MKRFYVYFLLAACVGISSVSAQSELWDKACKLAERGSSYLPCRMTSTAEVLNSNGTPMSVVETVMSMTYDSSGRLQATEMTQAFRDGKDITDELRKNMKESKDRKGAATAGPQGSLSGFNGMLFDAESRKKIRFLPGARLIEKNGKTIGSVPFEMDMGQGRKMTGSAEIDALTGVPQVVRMTGNAPFVKSLSVTLAYETLSCGGFVLSRMEIAGSVSALFVRKSFRDCVAMSDYREIGAL